MQKVAVPALILLLLALLAGKLSAQTCPTPPTGPYSAGVWTWYQYTPDDGCWSTSGASPTTLSCGGNGYSYGLGNGNKISYSFTIGQNDPVYQTWTADAFIEFNDPNDSYWNQIDIKARVVRNGVTYNYNLYHHNGTMGDLSGCMRQYGYFSATTGDTVTIEIVANKANSNATIKSSGAFIFTTNP